MTLAESASNPPSVSQSASIQNASTPVTSSGLTWLALFGVFSFVMVMASESDQYGEIAVALTWLAGLGATVYWWNDFDTNLANMIGIPASTVAAAGTPAV